MSNGHDMHAQQRVVVHPKVQKPATARLSSGASIVFSTLAVIAGSLVSLAAAQVLGVEEAWTAAGLGALGAITAAVVGGAGMLALRYTREGRRQALLDAASPAHPLMKRLITEAPGTYMHSLAAANLSEAAAEAIGADALAARVAAYYHDVGKLVQPVFFFENQNDAVNPHRHTSPADSADIIRSHVKDGLAIAEQYGLPPLVMNVIAEHHGTSLVRYFYHAAKKCDVGVYESDFRYQGRRPRSREAAIVMLADASEASIRAMASPDLAEVEAAVHSVIEERGADGQLADSGLTHADLDTISEVFVTQLMGYRHARCPYPAYAELASEGTCECG